MARSKKKSEAVAEEVMEAEVAEAMPVAEELELTAEEDVAPVVTEEVAVDPDAPKPEMTQDDIRLVEAILFASSSAVDERVIAERFPADRVSLIPDILAHLQEQYAGRGVNLVQRDRRWALRTATDLGEQMKLEKEQPRKFTRAAMETMAIIAYHQPVTRAEIENIRGVATSPGALDNLMEAGWIKPGKRREVPGRPVTWLSTQAFLDHFGLERLADLPGMEELKAAGLLDKRPAIEAMPNPADLFDGQEEVDPNEVTDEDLIGKSTSDDDEETETVETTAAAAAEVSEDDEEAEDSDESDDEDSDGEDADEDDTEASDDSDDDEDSDDEDEDDEDFDDDDDDDEEESEEEEK